MESYDSQQEFDPLSPFSSQSRYIPDIRQAVSSAVAHSSTGAGKAILKHEQYPPHPVPAPLFCLVLFREHCCWV